MKWNEYHFYSTNSCCSVIVETIEISLIEGWINAGSSLKLRYLDLPLVGWCINIFPPSCEQQLRGIWSNTIVFIARKCFWFSTEINTVLCLIKVNSNTIELTVHPSSNCVTYSVLKLFWIFEVIVEKVSPKICSHSKSHRFTSSHIRIQKKYRAIFCYFLKYYWYSVVTTALKVIISCRSHRYLLE